MTLYMALRAQKDWEQLLTEAGIPQAEAQDYSQRFVDNGLDETCLPELSKDLLADMGIKLVGHIIKVLKFAKAHSPSTESAQLVQESTATQSAKKAKPFNGKLPKLSATMTHPQFRRFEFDWKIYKKTTQITEDQIHCHLYNCCDDGVQNIIVHNIGGDEFEKLSEEAILKKLKDLVTQQSNPSVCRMKLHSILQEDGETVQELVTRVLEAVTDCEYHCPRCEYDYSLISAKDHFIRALSDDTLQTDILAKATTLKTFDATVQHAKAYETALRNKSILQEPSNTAMAARSRTSKYQRLQKPRTKPTLRKCRGCGSTEHTSFEQRKLHCPAFGQECEYCGILNHSASVCRQKQEKEQAMSLLASATPHGMNSKQITEIMVDATITFSNGRTFLKKVNAYPDSGASICLAGSAHLKSFKLRQHDLQPCKKLVCTAGNFTLICHSYANVTFSLGSNHSVQKVYICPRIKRLYLSKDACIDLKILPDTFPYPMDKTPTVRSCPDNLSSGLYAYSDSEITPRTGPPPKPTSLPFPITDKDIMTKLEKFLLDAFASSTFNSTGPFPIMHTKPAHIHLKDNAEPKAAHSPIPVPLCWMEQVKMQLDNDVAKGVLEPVPIGEAVNWCSRMVVVPKKDGSPRRTIDLQYLNSQCKRETHHSQPPFMLACQIPPNTKKTVLDATDGYHSIELDAESRPLTTFITPWGRYRYKRLPQGHLAAGDAYTHRYDDLIKNIRRKVKCIDDVCLYDNDTETAFFHAWDYLTLCANNGIVLNPAKFQFCRDEVTFAGLLITNSGVAPSEKIITAIRDFPTPENLQDARSWFGLVNQVSWAYAVSPIMAPFRELVKPKSEFFWDHTLQQLFDKSKGILIDKVHDGIKSFDPNRPTMLQTDWSKDGVGYLLLQKYCCCDISNGPTCCKEGWQLVFAGSRFTNEAESRYSPSEGEALAIAWGLKHSRFFTLGCPQLIISTDHRPLLAIFSDRGLDKIKNPRLQRLKEHTFAFRFTIQHNPGKWHKGPDALSRCPTSKVDDPDAPDSTLFHFSIYNDTAMHIEVDNDLSNFPHHTIAAFNSAGQTKPDEAANSDISPKGQITHKKFLHACTSDPTYCSLIAQIQQGFPKTRQALHPSLRQYWEVRDRLTVIGNTILLDSDRIVVPPTFCKQILSSLHSAHQGISGMYARAKSTLYWPGMNAAIRNTRYNCLLCNNIAPRQTKEPLILTPSPDYPFQQVCGDYFHVGGHSYFSYVDRFSGWITIFHFSPHQATSENLIKECRELFVNYGTPEIFSSDGGPQMVSTTFRKFLSDWNVQHRLSSAEYPQSNGRAELGVKSAKRIIMNNVSADGTLNNDKAAKAILQYRNTPLADINISPAQILFARNLRDQLPSHPKHYRLHKKWLLSSMDREKLLAERNVHLLEQYNRSSRILPELPVKTTVMVMENRNNKQRWNKTGIIVQVLPNRQYRVKMHGSGRTLLRNRTFLRKYIGTAPLRHMPYAIPSATSSPAIAEPTLIDTIPYPSIIPPAPLPQPAIPRMLQRLLPYNKPGRLETAPQGRRR